MSSYMLKKSLCVEPAALGRSVVLPHLQNFEAFIVVKFYHHSQQSRFIEAVI